MGCNLGPGKEAAALRCSISPPREGPSKEAYLPSGSSQQPGCRAESEACSRLRGEREENPRLLLLEQGPAHIPCFKVTKAQGPWESPSFFLRLLF